MPRLAIGVPVYNGERFLREAVESLLAQTFTDFQVVICDNASTDSTEQIGRELAARDPRVRYHRNPENIGAAPNFNHVFGLCDKTEFFKWAAADDTLEPTYLERCIEILDKDPGAVIGYTMPNFTNDAGEVVGRYEKKIATDSPRRAWRYRVLLNGHGCYEVFGVIRREILARTPLIGGYSRGDGVLLSYLAMYGRFEQHPEYLLNARKHEDQSMTMIDSWIRYSEWFDPRLKNKRVFPAWRWTFELLRALPAGGIGPVDLAYGMRYWLRYVWEIRKWLASDVAHHANDILGRTPRSPNGGAKPA